MLEPIGLLYGRAATDACAAGSALPLAGGPIAFTHARARIRGADTDIKIGAGTIADLRQWADGTPGAAQALDSLTVARPPFAGVDLARADGPLVMGVINATPDSFFADSRSGSANDAYDQARRMRDAGADIVDIGGESTRPGAVAVDPAEELDRVIPVVEKLTNAGVVVSVDTRHAATMRAAIRAGARIVNDVSALCHDAASLDTVASGDCSAVLMHMRGQPATMQQAPDYEDVLWEVHGYLRGRIDACKVAGVELDRLCVDPGIGFGKTPQHSAALLSGLGGLHSLGCAVLVGASRKSFIAGLSRNEPAEARLPGSLAAVCIAARAGAQIVRVHDVVATKQVLRVWQGVVGH